MKQTIRKKNPPDFCKWEADTTTGEYVVIRYKNAWLDVKISKSHDNFVMGYWRAIYRQKLERADQNEISLEEVIDILNLNVSEINYY